MIRGTNAKRLRYDDLIALCSAPITLNSVQTHHKSKPIS